MPGEPKETKTTVQDGGRRHQGFSCSRSTTATRTMSSDTPTTPRRSCGPPAPMQPSSRGSQKGAVTGVKGTLLTSKKIKQDGFPGLEFSYNLTAAGVPGKAVGRSRLILVKNRLYQVVVIAALSKAKSAANGAFLRLVRVRCPAPPLSRPSRPRPRRRAAASEPFAKRRAQRRSRIANGCRADPVQRPAVREGVAGRRGLGESGSYGEPR